MADSDDDDFLGGLFDNNRAWAKQIEKNNPGFFDKLAKQQLPRVLWIGCSDSRVPANEIIGMLRGQDFGHGRMPLHCPVPILRKVETRPGPGAQGRRKLDKLRPVPGEYRDHAPRGQIDVDVGGWCRPLPPDRGPVRAGHFHDRRHEKRNVGDAGRLQCPDRFSGDVVGEGP